MTVSVAEYLGRRTDADEVIHPIAGKVRIPCPFASNKICSKASQGTHPVCSVRNSDGTLWLNCEHRLCCTTKNMDDPNRRNHKIPMPLSEYQSNILLSVGQTIFGANMTFNDILIKREVPLRVNEDTARNYKADFIMARRNDDYNRPGPNRLIVEMQGGGETSNTGGVKDHLNMWRENQLNNAFLRQPIDKVNTLETNAWRRQQEQFIVKGNIAAQTWKGYGLAFCVGTLFYDYIMSKVRNIAILPDLREHNWTLALIGIKEETNVPIQSGPIPLAVDESRLLFTNYQTFVHALINQGLPSSDAFMGEFRTLENEVVNITTH